MNIDWGTLFQVDWSMNFFLALMNIMFINLILSGDNAVVIAMAVRNLPKSQRMRGIAYGTAAAVVILILFTYFVALLLEINFIKLVGGALILWIAVKLFMEADDGAGKEKEVSTLWQAMRIILVANLTMSLDNVLAVAGVAGGNLFLLIFGLCLSIPIVTFTSNLISILMDRYPLIIVIGGAVLGRVGGEMIVTDPFIDRWLHPAQAAVYAVQVICTIGVVVAGKSWMRWKIARTERAEEESSAGVLGEVTEKSGSGEKQAIEPNAIIPR
ncbi:MAG TPA: TerC family protein [Syntrophales bacterium]|nr:TerC family protein [Syntrophales bacterium]